MRKARAPPRRVFRKLRPLPPGTAPTSLRSTTSPPPHCFKGRWQLTKDRGSRSSQRVTEIEQLGPTLPGTRSLRKAEPLFQRALAINEKVRGEDSFTAEILHNWAG